MMRRLFTICLCSAVWCATLSSQAFATPTMACKGSVIRIHYVDAPQYTNFYGLMIEMGKDAKGTLDGGTTPTVTLTKQGTAEFITASCSQQPSTDGSGKVRNITACLMPWTVDLNTTYQLSFEFKDADGKNCSPHESTFSFSTGTILWGPTSFADNCPKQPGCVLCVSDSPILKAFAISLEADGSVAPLDSDKVPEYQDNCPFHTNANQGDSDNDTIGTACDNCPAHANTNQLDNDHDGIGNACDTDSDGDGIDNDTDNCPTLSNPLQEDKDSDGIGNYCDTDIDGDGILNDSDNCPLVPNPGQEDTDLNSNNGGNACSNDADGDGVPNDEDNCPEHINSGQEDYDGDNAGNACDTSPGTKPEGGTSGTGGTGGDNGCPAERLHANGSCCDEGSLFYKPANACVSSAPAAKTSDGACGVFSTSFTCSGNAGGDGNGTTTGDTEAADDAGGCTLIHSARAASPTTSILTQAKRQAGMLLFLISLGATALLRYRQWEPF